ncbi:MAG: hypothetical protein MUF45_16865 [Spirosomaceae bacterium]|jgi:hypothetical protein|nr:hypothetical protein [Spirosomataceae bacterium]
MTQPFSQSFSFLINYETIMQKLKLILFILFVTFISTSCKEEIEPTGSIKITVRDNFFGQKYELYPGEAAISPNFFPQPLVRGTIPPNTSSVTIDNLNEGNYILNLTSISYYVQVTRGKVKEYRF